MLNTSLLTEELTGLVGLYAGFDPDSDQPGPRQQNPVVYLSDAHKLLRPEFISALGPDLASIYIEPYDPDTTYQWGDLVAVGEQVYKSISINNDFYFTSPLDWVKTTKLSAWYERIESGSIAKLALALSQNPATKPVLSRQPLYQKEGNLQGLISKSNRFLALRLSVDRLNVAISIARTGLQLSGPVENFPLYIFRSDKRDPVGVVLLTGNTSGRTVWQDSTAQFTTSDELYYLIGYFESDLPAGVNAIGAERGFTVEGCSSCLGADYGLAQNRTGLLSIQPIVVEGNPASGLLSWATETEITRQTWGINLIIEASCDATATLLQYRDMLLNSLLYLIACDVLEEISTSTRVNGVTAQYRNEAYVALNGQANTKSDIGLKGEKNRIIADLKKVMESIAPDCMATEVPRRGVSFGSLF